MTVAAAPRVLCKLEAIPDGEGLGFTLEDEARTAIFVVRQGARVHGYVNSCPHAGTPLDWTPDRFLTYDKRHILCATHGARFRIYDGYCFAGPCQGDRLTPLDVEVVNGEVILKAPPA